MTSLLDRFCKYVQMETTANEDTDKYPSSPGQLELGKVVASELHDLKLADVQISPHGIVTATVPATVEGAPTIAWLAHLDTSPEYTAKGVKPIVHRNYDGKDIPLPGDPSKVIRVADCPELEGVKGKTLVTTDGTTLLGADDKCGLAVIMDAAQRLMAHPEIKHGPIRVCFTCDEEIGRGVDHVDIKALGARVAYTLDGEDEGILEDETFSADLATVTITGINIHPGLATGRMVNAIRIAGAFVDRMPRRRLSPETTSGREGFMHPYTLEASVASARIKIILRSFVTAELADQARLLHEIAASLRADFHKAEIHVDIKEQYRNMADGLIKEPRAVELAKQAMRNLGIEPAMHSIRGGTDGSRLTERGLPTPNLSVGMHNFHSPLEWACLEQMETSVKVLVELAKCWGNEKA